MQSYCLHKAPDNYRNSPEFLRYVRWEGKRYPWPPGCGVHIPDESKIAYYHELNSHLRRRLCEAARIKDEEKRQERFDFLYKLIDINMGRIFHERNPAKWADPFQKFSVPISARRERRETTIRYLPGIGPFHAPKSEPIMTGTDAHPV